MKTSPRTTLRRGAAVLAAGALMATGLSLATAAPASAASYDCTITFTPNEIGPGQSTQVAIDLDTDIEDYYGIMAVDGVPGDPVDIGSTSSILPYDLLVQMYPVGADPVVLDYQIYWKIPARLAGPAEPMCHATLTLLPAKPDPKPDPQPEPENGKVSLQAPKSLPLSAGSAKLRATSTTEGPIALTSQTPKVCTVNGSAAKLRRAGICRVSAAQAGAETATARIRVWATPVVPRKAVTPRVVTVLGRGEHALRVQARPASVCRVAGGSVALIDAGTCRITVRDRGNLVRRAHVKVALAANSATTKHGLARAATVYFDFDSARLTERSQAVLRAQAKKLRKARLVVVYGHTFGPGKNSKHSRALAERRARAVVAYLADHGVRAKTATVSLAMQQPVSKTPRKNRRVEIYYR